MLKLALDGDEYAEFMATLAGSAQIKTTVQILDNEHRILGSVSHLLLDGQTDVVAAKLDGGNVAVSRTSTCSFLDPGRTLALDSGSPADGALYLDRMIRTVVSVRCSFGWVDVPIFTGPVIKVDRDGDIVNVEAHGKEAFALGEAYTPGVFTGQKVQVIRDLLARCGEIERYIDMVATSAQVTKAVSISRESKLWVEAFRIARSADGLLFYDGRGICRYRKKSPKPVAVVRASGDSLVLSDPQISYSTEEMKNVVRVTGRATDGMKSGIVGTAVAPSTHPLNAYKLGRNSKPVWHALFEDNPDIRTTTAATRLAQSLLEDTLAQTVEVTFDMLPLYHLEPWDLLRLETPDFALSFRPQSFTIPWTVAAPMTVGYTRRVTRPQRPVRSA